MNQIGRSDAILQTGQVGKRGGSWNNNPRNCRSAYRNYNTPDTRNNNIGFRVVCSAPSTLHYQIWQVGYLLGVSRRVQTCSGDASASKNQTEPGSLVSLAEELPGSNILLEVQHRMAELVIRRERKQAHYFVEKLGELIGLDIILIPAGTFLMGSPEDEDERQENEGPQHEVAISTFFMGRYPITQIQWRFVAGLPQEKRELSPKPSHFKGDDRPVEQVSWSDAVEFCDRLSAYTGRDYRLPTEAEWEYACRAGTQTPFYFGKTLTTELANYNGNSTYNDGLEGEYREETTPVGNFGIANAFGLCDMHGNVFEWCQDHWHENYEGAPTDGSAWLSKYENAPRVRRGGSWNSDPRNCRSACRHFSSLDHRSYPLGFRVVCSTPRTL